MNFNKKNLLITKIINQKDPRKEIEGIHFTKNYTEATNGSFLVRVTYPKQYDSKDLPEIIKTQDKNEINNFILPAEQINKISVTKNNSYPEQIFIDVNETNKSDKIKLIITDLENTFCPDIKKIEAIYPDTEKCFPDTKPLNIIYLNVEFLEKICNIAKQFTKNDKNHRIQLKIYTKYLEIITSNKNDQQMRSLIALFIEVKEEDFTCKNC